MEHQQHYPQHSETSSLGLLYTQPIEVIGTPQAYSKDSEASQVILSAMIIWNMAMICHLKGYTTTASADHKDANRQFRMARSLYIDCLTLVQHILERGSNGNPTVDLFLQALLNNLGDCCWQLQEYYEAGVWARALLSYARSSLGSAPHQEEEDSSILATLKEQTRLFALNAVTLLHIRPSHLAAAA
jgi:hypothetical protein